MAAVNAGSGLTDLNNPAMMGTDLQENKNLLQDSEIPLGPDQAAEEAKKEEILAKIRTIEEEVVTLRQALNRKENQLALLRKEVGITAWSQLKEGIGNTYQGVQQSHIYQKTSESLKNVNDKIVQSDTYNKLSYGASATKGVLVDAGGKTVEAMKTASTATAKKLGEIRDSTMFHSIESKVLSASASIKDKVVGPRQSTFDESDTTAEAQPAQETVIKEPTSQGPSVF